MTEKAIHFPCFRTDFEKKLLYVVLVGIVLISPAVAEVISNANFEITFPDGETALAEQTLRVLTALAEEHAAYLPLGEQKVRVFICNTLEEFNVRAGRYGQRYVTGFADSEAGVIVVKSPRMREAGGDYTGTLRHELMHVLLARNTDPDYLPRWLNEGACLVASKEYRWNSYFQVAKMYAQGRLMPFWQLSFAFLEPGREQEFGDAYAESLLLTQFMLNRFGADAFWSMIAAMKTKPFEQALREKTGLAPADLWDAWKRSLWKVALVSALVSGFSLFQVMAVLTVVAYLRKRRRGKQIIERWDEEEQDEPFMTVRELEDTEEPFPWEDDDDDERW